MIQTFYNGVSGAKTHQFGMNVWANNISNINTIGFRGKRPEFENLFSHTLNTASINPVSSQIGLGSTGQTTAMMEGVGSYIDGEADFDMAIFGDGWFGTRGYDGQTYYTRKGDFFLDVDGNLTARNGNILLGTMGNFAGERIVTNDNIDLGSVDNQQPIKLPSTLYMPSSPTTQVALKANIDAKRVIDLVDVNLENADFTSNLDKNNKIINIQGDAKNVKGLLDPKQDDLVMISIKDKDGVKKNITTKLKDDLTWQIDPTQLANLDLDNDLDISVTIRSMQEAPSHAHYMTDVISANGGKKLLKIEFDKNVPSPEFGSSWKVSASIFDEDDNVISKNEGQMTFNEFGGLASNTLTSVTLDGTKIDLNFGTFVNANTNLGGFDGVTATGKGTSSTGNILKNGNLEGNLKKYYLDDYGLIQAILDNSMNVPVAKVALFHFQNDPGLTNVGGSFYLQSANSGEAIFYDNQNAFSPYIKSRKLETSNVDLGVALTEVIVMQKAFDASSKSITTADQLLQNAINMKR